MCATLSNNVCTCHEHIVETMHVTRDSFSAKQLHVIGTLQANGAPGGSLQKLAAFAQEHDVCKGKSGGALLIHVPACSHSLVILVPHCFKLTGEDCRRGA